MIIIFSMFHIDRPWIPELGASLFQIALALFALKQTLISGAREGYKKKSEEQKANRKIHILSDRRKKERINSKSDFKDQTVIMVEICIKMHDLYIF